MSRSKWQPSRRERLRDALEVWWIRVYRCGWLGVHREKMDSHGNCIWCGEPMPRGGGW